MQVTFDGRIFIGNKEEASNLEFLKELGITAILNVANDLNDPIYDNIVTTKVGLRDDFWPLNDVYLAATVLDKLVKQNHKVFVHCHEGKCRSPFVVILWAILYRGMDFSRLTDEITVDYKDWMASIMELIVNEQIEYSARKG